MEEDWGMLTKGVCFITDLGENADAYDRTVQRYAVWIPEQDGQGKHRITEVGGDLQKLQSKYNVGPEYVFRVQG